MRRSVVIITVVGLLLVGAGAVRSGRETAVAIVPPTPDLPRTLSIPRIGVEAPITPVGLSAAGDMDMPDEAETTGWYERGPHPGQQGNAVIAGHLDTMLGTPAVFAELHTLKIGDSVFVEDASGVKREFKVIAAHSYDPDRAPLAAIFGNSNERRLTLITCDGSWDHARHMYNRRLVIFTVLADSLR